MSPNKRRSSRQIVNLPAWIGVDNDADLRKCKIVDLSGFGARLVVEDVEALPDKFELFLSRLGDRCHPCRVIWKRGNEIGIGFVGGSQKESIGTMSVGPLLRELGGLRGLAARLGQNDNYTMHDGLRPLLPGTAHDPQSGLLRKISALFSSGLGRDNHSRQREQ